MLVYQHWRYVPHTCSLLYSIAISYENIYHKFIDMVDQLCTRPGQVKELNLHHCINSQFDKGKLLRLFPNLRTAIMTKNPTTQPCYYFNTHFETYHSVSKVQEPTNLDKCELFQYLATSNLCTKLKKLQLNSLLFRGTNGGSILKLKKMPVLEYLKIHLERFEINDLDIFHTNIPTFKALRLNTNMFRESDLLCNIRSASFSTTLSIDTVCQYIIKNTPTWPTLN
ncbi:hypothetical protein K501DRAFT_266343 [Backusella circina FSU 941]|nr:hypothetical protein K501DRAFT_266343 [Backusella circina FSU 941]